MKIVIRKLATGEYLAEEGHWTKRFEEARDFPTTSDTDFFVRKNKVSDVEVIIKGTESPHEIPVAKYTSSDTEAG